MITTMIIGVPSAIKTFNWLGTLYKGNIHYTVAMMNALAFVAMFVIGGLSGIWMASTPVDMYIHDTYFIVAHIHYVLFGGSLFGIFAGITYWYPKMFGRMMSEKLGKVHFWITFVAFNCTFFPMHILGMAGHMRRIYNPQQYDFLKPIIPINEFHFDQRVRAGRRAVPVPREHHLRATSGARRPARIRGMRIRWNGRRRRRRRTATGPDRCRSFTGDRTSTARLRSQRITCRNRS